ncbi:MAG TPA: DUF1697 domain-containing protein [Terriglobales bacterium]|nr:DUF1697 domain-containing protein [Terriglobales bacterium]
MPVLLAFLRGINVGGSRLVLMSDLRALLTGLRLRSVQTHLQSGNALFQTDEKDLPRLSEKIATALERRFGFPVDVVLRTHADLEAVIADNPFARSKGIEPGKLVVFFLPKAVEKARHDEIAQLKFGREEIQFGRRELYIYFPDGQGRSKLPAALDRILDKTATARNWNTVTKLLELAKNM